MLRLGLPKLFGRGTLTLLVLWKTRYHVPELVSVGDSSGSGVQRL